MSKDFNKDDDLEKMLEAASEKTDESTEESNENKSSPKKAILITSGAMLTFGVLLATGAFMLRPQEFEDKTETPTWVDEKKEEEETISQNSEWDFEYPVEVPEWTKQPFNEDLLKDDKKLAEVNKFADEIQALQSSVSWMPTGIQGDWEGAATPYTNDVADEFINENIINPEYSYTLKEDYMTAYSTYIQRLINPTFGDWLFAQRYMPAKNLKNDETYQVLNDMFSEDWWNNNIEEGVDYSAIPTLTDWNGDNFGGLEFAEAVPGRYGTFFGVVNETENQYVTVESLGNDDRNSEILKIDTPVKYVAFGPNDELIEKLGTLSMTLSSNSESIDYNRVVITATELKFD